MNTLFYSVYFWIRENAKRKFSFQFKTVSGSVTFGYGSGSADPYHWITDPYPSYYLPVPVLEVNLHQSSKIGKKLLKVVTSEKIGGSGVTSTLGTWYGGVVMGVRLYFNEAAILYRDFNSTD